MRCAPRDAGVGRVCAVLYTPKRRAGGLWGAPSSLGGVCGVHHAPKESLEGSEGCPIPLRGVWGGL